ncbi:hypothetical protein Tco_0677140 [Tanacetum coccineum]
MGTVAEYESGFLILANRVIWISQSLLTSFYISGLKLELQRELFRSWPTTLGEAFSLARIVEARYEDERPTITIAKPNDLTARAQVIILSNDCKTRDEPNRICWYDIHHDALPYTVEVLHQISPSDIQFSNLEELQENQEEHICYYYWENCFSILNAEEADNTKSPLSADTFGNNGGDQLETSVPALSGDRPSGELSRKESADALSRTHLEETRSGRHLAKGIEWTTVNGSHFIFVVDTVPNSGGIVPTGGSFRRRNGADHCQEFWNRKVWKIRRSLDDKSEDRKVERDDEREGEPNILAPFGSDRGLFMASGGSDPDAENALFRLLQRGTVAEYQNEFEMLISRVTGKSDSLLASIYIFGLKSDLQRALLWSYPTTLGGYQNKASDFFTTPEVAHEVATEVALEVASEAVRETTTAADTVAKIE